MNADEEQKKFTDQLPDQTRRNLLRRTGAAVVGTGLAAVSGTAQSGDGYDSAIELLIRAFASGYDSAKPVEGDKPAPAKDQSIKPAMLTQQSAYSTDYGQAQVRTLAAPQFDGDEPKKAYQKIIDSLNQIPGAKKGEELPNGIRVFANGKSPKSIPKGLTDFAKNTRLTPQEKSQVLGLLVLLFRSGAVVTGSSDDETRTRNGAQAIARLAQLCPEVTRIEYSWYKPIPVTLDKQGKPPEKKPFHYVIAKGNLGEFLASDIQYFSPHRIDDSKQENYTLYDNDKGFTKAFLTIIEKGAAAQARDKAQR